ncbi:unnamed protein product, partial [Mesorhabditis belari]|uniref:Uncharacterized protein n=1 Tax=Mesorhabditis belari TaxID=2138241 RepID=A0AAF3FG46_9BILA
MFERCALPILLFVHISLCDLSRQDLVDFLRFKQETRNTFDSRVHQRVKPIGTIAGKPIWPKIVDRVEGAGEIFFDDDNFAYRSNSRTAADMIREMDREKEYKFVIEHLNRLISANSIKDGTKYYG